MTSSFLMGTAEVPMTCVYHSKVENSFHIYLLLCVGNMLIVSQNLLATQKLKSLLSNEFEMKDMGVAEKILGVEIKSRRSYYYVRRNTLRKC